MNIKLLFIILCCSSCSHYVRYSDMNSTSQAPSPQERELNSVEKEFAETVFSCKSRHSLSLVVRDKQTVKSCQTTDINPPWLIHTPSNCKFERLKVTLSSGEFVLLEIAVSKSGSLDSVSFLMRQNYDYYLYTRQGKMKMKNEFFVYPLDEPRGLSSRKPRGLP